MRVLVLLALLGIGCSPQLYDYSLDGSTVAWGLTSEDCRRYHKRAKAAYPELVSQCHKVRP